METSLTYIDNIASRSSLSYTISRKRDYHLLFCQITFNNGFNTLLYMRTLPCLLIMIIKLIYSTLK